MNSVWLACGGCGQGPVWQRLAWSGATPVSLLPIGPLLVSNDVHPAPRPSARNQRPGVHRRMQEAAAVFHALQGSHWWFEQRLGHTLWGLPKRFVGPSGRTEAGRDGPPEHRALPSLSSACVPPSFQSCDLRNTRKTRQRGPKGGASRQPQRCCTATETLEGQDADLQTAGASTSRFLRVWLRDRSAFAWVDGWPYQTSHKCTSRDKKSPRPQSKNRPGASTDRDHWSVLRVLGVTKWPVFFHY